MNKNREKRKKKFWILTNFDKNKLDILVLGIAATGKTRAFYKNK